MTNTPVYISSNGGKIYHTSLMCANRKKGNGKNGLYGSAVESSLDRVAPLGYTLCTICANRTAKSAAPKVEKTVKPAKAVDPIKEVKAEIKAHMEAIEMYAAMGRQADKIEVEANLAKLEETLRTLKAGK